MVECDRPGLM